MSSSASTQAAADASGESRAGLHESASITAVAGCSLISTGLAMLRSRFTFKVCVRLRHPSSCGRRVLVHVQAPESACRIYKPQDFVDFGGVNLQHCEVALNLRQIMLSPARGSVKLKLAIEFCKFGGSQSTFRSLFEEDAKPSGEYHNVYSPADILQARLKLMDVDEVPARPTTLPPIMYFRMAKGGVGKTTLAGNIAACMSSMGYRILMIDADPQASLTSLFGIDWTTTEIAHLGHLLQANEQKRPIDWNSVVKPIYPDGMMDMIASDITLSDIDTWLTSVMNREACVKRLFDNHLEFFSRYDAIIIDSAPGTTQLSNALMYAARSVVAVVKLDGQSLKAMEVLNANMREMADAYPELGLGVRLIANGFDARITTCKEALDTLRAGYPGLLDTNVIPQLSSFARQISLLDDNESGPVLEREPNSQAARAMIELTRSLISHFDVHLAGLIPVVEVRRPGRKKKVTTAQVVT